MFNIQPTLKAIAAVGVIGAMALTCAAQTAAPAAKKKAVKDQGEFELYNQAIKDASNPTKELQDLDAWAQKYPESDFKDDRTYMYMQAYSTIQPPQPLKVIEYGQQLMAKDLNTIFPDAAGGRNILTVLFQVAWNVAALPNPTPDQLADLEANVSEDVQEIDARWKAAAAESTTLAVSLERTDVKVTQLNLVWLPVP